jgi:hypothetical protein
MQLPGRLKKPAAAGLRWNHQADQPREGLVLCAQAWLGMPLAGVVLTIEPGLYIPDDEAFGRLRGIGVRIEDDVAVTGKIS